MTDPSGDVPYERLHPNARLNWMLGSVIGAMVLTLLVALAELTVLRPRVQFPWPRGVPAISMVGGLLLAVGSAVAAAMKFAAFGYALRASDLVVRSGVIWRVRRCVPRARVQHVDIASGPIDRAFGLVEVSLFVAGGMGPVARIPGMAPEAAERLKEALLVEQRTDGV